MTHSVSDTSRQGKGGGRCWLLTCVLPGEQARDDVDDRKIAFHVYWYSYRADVDIATLSLTQDYGMVLHPCSFDAE